MVLLGVSGGPDSMFLLSKYKKKSIVVVHVNYNKRDNSQRDLEIVRNYCHNFQIQFESLNVRSHTQGNFEKWARDLRYDFFQHVYHKYNCSQLLIAHHKDDFLETALMQHQSNRKPSFFGIRKLSFRLGMQIKRPLINLYWKEEILKLLEKRKITFVIDKTNFDLSFQRNKIRQEISSWDLSEKQELYSWFKNQNKILQVKNKKIDKCFLKWEATNFQVSFFRQIPNFKSEILHEYIVRHFENVKLSSSKIISIIKFVESSNSNVFYKLNLGDFIFKYKGFLKTN